MSWLKDYYKKLAPEFARRLDETVVAARAHFEEFAGNDIGDPLPEHPIDSLQLQLWRWQNRNFGIQPDNNIMLGVMEEVGETFVAADQHDLDGMIDGLGDIQVYVGQLATANRLALRDIQKLAEFHVGRWEGNGDDVTISEMDPLGIMGHCCHCVLKHVQAIRGMEDEAIYRTAIVDVCARMLASTAVHITGTIWDTPDLTMVDTGGNSLLVHAYVTTVETVLKRDWVADRKTGVTAG